MERKLDIGCGQHPREGFEGADLYAPGALHKIDFFKFPWPFADDTFDELYCSHFVEHIPAREVEPRDLAPGGLAFGYEGCDMFFAFFDECYRILKPGGIMKVIVPFGRSARGFQDPTHRRFLMAETFGYLSREWRKVNGLDHYRVECHFASDIVPTVGEEMNLMSPERAGTMMAHYWNVIHDLHVTLKSGKVL